MPQLPFTGIQRDDCIIALIETNEINFMLLYYRTKKFNLLKFAISVTWLVLHFWSHKLTQAIVYNFISALINAYAVYLHLSHAFFAACAFRLSHLRITFLFKHFDSLCLFITYFEVIVLIVGVVLQEVLLCISR